MVPSQGLLCSCRQMGARTGTTKGGQAEAGLASLLIQFQGFSTWAGLRFLITWRLGSQSEHPKKSKAEVHGIFMIWPQKL